MAITVRDEDDIKKIEALVNNGHASTKTKLIGKMANEYEELLECREQLERLKRGLALIRSIETDDANLHYLD